MDSDSDNEDFVSFGTPLEVVEEDEPLPKPVSVEDQVVKDRQGRQRFHGAFTGGFSAGFFNTVGSKEGFTPSTFVSSRGSRAGQQTQKPEDFMDNDDIGEYGIAPRKVVTTQRFAGEETESKKRPAAGSSIIPDDGRIQDIIKPTDDTIGTRLLRRMGWKPGQGIGPKIERRKKKRGTKKSKGPKRMYGCSGPPGADEEDDDEEGDDVGNERRSDDSDSDEDLMKGFLFAPDDVQDFIFALKDDTHGIGYRGLDSSRSVLGGYVTLFEEPVTSKSRRQGFRGHAFGIGAFEEDDDDVYSADRLSNYDRVLGGEEETKGKKGMYGWTGPPPKSSGDYNVLEGFKSAAKKKLSSKVFAPPALPRDFRPFHRVGPSAEATPHPKEAPAPAPAHSRFTMSAPQRAAMLGEEQLPGPSSIDEMLSSKDLAFLKDARNKASSTQPTPPPPPPTDTPQSSRWDRGAPQWAAPTLQAATGGGGSSFKPFSGNPEKQTRYEEYLKKRHHGPQAPSSGDPRTEWERQQERDEFSRAAALYQPMSGLMASRFVRAKREDADDTVEVPAETGGDEDDQSKAAEMKMFGQLTRDTMEWHPDKLLCKRFNVADPYPESTIVGPPTVKKDKYSVFNFLQIPQPTSAQIDIYPSQHASGTEGCQDASQAVEDASSSSSQKRSRWDQHPGILSSIGSKEDETSEESSAKESNKESTSKPSADVSEADEDRSRPPMDLFQAIFLDSGSSSSDDDDDDEDDDNKSEGKDSNTTMSAPFGNGVPILPTPSSSAQSSDVAMTTRTDSDNMSGTRETIERFTSVEVHKISTDSDSSEESENRDDEESGKEDEEEEEYGPMLPPSIGERDGIDKSGYGVASQHPRIPNEPSSSSLWTEKDCEKREGRRRERRREKSKKKKRKKDVSSRSRSSRRRDDEEDVEKHKKEKHRRDSRDRSNKHEKKHKKSKKTKHSHKERRSTSSHRKSSGSRKKDARSSSDASPSSDQGR